MHCGGRAEDRAATREITGSATLWEPKASARTSKAKEIRKLLELHNRGWKPQLGQTHQAPPAAEHCMHGSGTAPAPSTACAAQRACYECHPLRGNGSHVVQSVAICIHHGTLACLDIDRIPSLVQEKGAHLPVWALHPAQHLAQCGGTCCLFCQTLL